MLKINESQRVSSIQAYRGAQAKDMKSTSAGKSASKDDIRISSEAKELLEAQRANDANRAGRIEALKESVQAGTYRVSAEQLAEKLFPFLK